ncbi:MAG: RIP metalloprotease RseP, partial [Methylococcaceae bacterium]
MDLPYAFNRQPLSHRAAIVAAGPAFNFALAVLLYWDIFMLGETGLRPVLGQAATDTLAAKAGFMAGDEILSVAGTATPTWDLVLTTLLEQAVDHENMDVEIKKPDDTVQVRTLNIPQDIAQNPELLHRQLGFKPYDPELPARIGALEPHGAAEKSGIQSGDLLVSVNDIPIRNWQHWVEFIRSHPEQTLTVTLDKTSGVRTSLALTPLAVDTPEGRIGRIGAGVAIPEEIENHMRVIYRLEPWPALVAASSKTLQFSALTLKMVGKMVMGRAAVDNLSGPISIAQYAGQSARLGYIAFLKFLALISISLGILNLLPIPVLDGGHLLFYAIEAIKGSPVSDKTQLRFQHIGVSILIGLMGLALFLDIERLFS